MSQADELLRDMIEVVDIMCHKLSFYVLDHTVTYGDYQGDDDVSYEVSQLSEMYALFGYLLDMQDKLSGLSEPQFKCDVPCA